MRLLIVDDEKITRDGLMNQIDWQSLGIHEIAQADDGIHGLELSSTFQPDIVISDVRMPRMNGIEMAQKLQETNHDLHIIFMSGYSDKEYLKAAIKLKAVSYVEKPIDLEELSEAVIEAKDAVLDSKKAESSKLLSIHQASSALAVRLTTPVQNDTLISLTNELDFHFPIDENTAFFTILIQFHHNTYSQNTLHAMIETSLKDIFAKQHLMHISANRQGLLYVFHIWGFKAYTDYHKHELGTLLESALTSLHLQYHIVFGKNVNGASNICNSYNSAVIELQNSFFYENNTHRIYEHHDTYKTFRDLSRLDTSRQLFDLLCRKDKDAAQELLKQLFTELLTNKNALPNQIKDLYYKLLTTLRDAYAQLQILSADSDELDNSIWGHISACESLYELHALLSDKINAFFSLADTQSKEHSTVFLIKEFIANHYQDETLSIKNISEHVFLSSSYICTLFKTETDQTLNQYLTNYRIERAKKLLTDPRYKITDISTKVGYSDGNYFGKIFKKNVGMSPSEYREQKGNH